MISGTALNEGRSFLLITVGISSSPVSEDSDSASASLVGSSSGVVSVRRNEAQKRVASCAVVLWTNYTLHKRLLALFARRLTELCCSGKARKSKFLTIYDIYSQTH